MYKNTNLSAFQIKIHNQNAAMHVSVRIRNKWSMFNTEIIDEKFKNFEDKGHNYLPVTNYLPVSISCNRTVPLLLIARLNVI